MSQGSDSYASGRYLVQKKLGAGSFGAAYLVEDREAGSLLYVLYNQGCTEMMLFQHLLLRFCLATLSWPASLFQIVLDLAHCRLQPQSALMS